MLREFAALSEATYDREWDCDRPDVDGFVRARICSGSILPYFVRTNGRRVSRPA